MNMESEIFRGTEIDINKLLKYGFIKEKDNYILKKSLIDNFEVVISIDKESNVSCKIIDTLINDEYLGYRFKEQNGNFVNLIRSKYIEVLKDILNKCFIKHEFVYEQSNRVNDYIKSKYNVEVEHLWDKDPGCGVYRNKNSNKWFSIIMDVKKNKIVGKEEIIVEVINVKLDNEVSNYLKVNGIYPAYHMSKKYWVSIILDNTIVDKDVFKLIDISYSLSDKRSK